MSKHCVQCAWNTERAGDMASTPAYKSKFLSFYVFLNVLMGMTDSLWDSITPYNNRIYVISI